MKKLLAAIVAGMFAGAAFEAWYEQRRPGPLTQEQEEPA